MSHHFRYAKILAGLLVATLGGAFVIAQPSEQPVGQIVIESSPGGTRINPTEIRGALITPEPRPTLNPGGIIISDADSDEEGSTQPMVTVTNQYPPNLLNVRVKLGNEVLFEDSEYTNLIRGRKIGLITNPTGMDTRFIPTIDKLAAGDDWELTALFAPEHGIRGAETAGESVKSGVDPVTSTPVFSLHGNDADGKPLRKPRPKQLENVDMLMYDIQDIGNRSYTYVGTMRKCMEAAKEQNIPFVVLDRPNPMGGKLVDGNVLDPKFESLVGWAPVPYLYGLTAGEVAMWMNEETGIDCELTVVPMRGWTRDMKWWDTGLPWVPTSTHMQDADACWFIALTGFLGELLSVNVGVGYPAPFEYVGAPWIDSIDLANELNSRKLTGLYFRPVFYKPFYNTHEGKQCGGVQAIITDLDAFRPVEAGTHLVAALQKLYPEQDILKMNPDTPGSGPRGSMFDKVMGTDQVRRDLAAGKPAEEITASWKAERDKFVESSRKYLMYP